MVDRKKQDDKEVDLYVVLKVHRLKRQLRLSFFVLKLLELSDNMEIYRLR